MRKFPAVFVCALVALYAHAENPFGKQIFSINFGYTVSGLRNNGLGFELGYEREVFRWFSVQGSFSHMTVFPRESGIVITTVGVGAGLLCYPFGRGLEWLYLGGLCNTGFFMYDGGSVESGGGDTVISLSPVVGWKHSFAGMVMVDVFAGYRFVLNPGEQQEIISRHIRNSLEYGIKVKVNWVNVVAFFREGLGGAD